MLALEAWPETPCTANCAERLLSGRGRQLARQWSSLRSFLAA